MKLVRDLNGEGEIVEIRDERNRLLVTLAYEVIPLGERTVYDRSERRLKLLTDYRGRSVVYHYDVADGGKLSRVVDVRGREWRMTYNDKLFTGFIDPENRKTSVEMTARGGMLGYKNSDGVGEKYLFSYNAGSAEFSLRKFNNSGQVEELRYNHLGDRVGRVVNGTVMEQQAEITGSDGVVLSGLQATAYAQEINTTWKRVWVSGSGLTAQHFCIDGRVVSSGSGTVDPTYERQCQEGAVDSPADNATPQGKYITRSAVRDERGQSTAKHYNSWQEEVKREYPDGSVERFEYQTLGGYERVLVSHTDREG